MAVVLARKPGGAGGGGGGAPSGPAGGDLSGTYPNPALSAAKQAELDGKVPKSLYDANTVLAATTDDTPAAVTMAASTILARLAAGNIKAATPAELRTLLALVIGTNVQAWDADLDSIAAVTSAADKMLYATAAQTWTVATLTSFARTILDDADAATARATLGAVAAPSSTTLHNLRPEVFAISADSSAAPGANAAVFSPFLVSIPMTINRITLNINTSSGNIDVGIYAADGTNNAPGTRLVSAGSTASPGTNARTLTIADTLLQPGLYYAAYAADNGTSALAYETKLVNAAISRYDKASSFPLPASIVTPTASLQNIYVLVPSAAT